MKTDVGDKGKFCPLQYNCNFIPTYYLPVPHPEDTTSR